jgi:hypothetical protein
MIDTSDSKVVAVVDAYSTASLLAPEFVRRGWQCVHINSGAFILELLRPTFSGSHFKQDIKFDGDVPALVGRLRELGVSQILPGTETDGVLLADQLSAALGAPGNDPATGSQRRNKYEMLEAIRAAGLKATKQLKTDQAEEAISWIADVLRNTWPVVIKPLNSTATDGLHFCRSESEVRACFQELLGRPNCLGLVNGELLVQELLRGREYTVNMVSWNGEHRVSEIWEMHKVVIPGAGAMYDTIRLVPRIGLVQRQLSDYVSRALDALGHRFGPSHNEVMLTPEGPCLIETGARLAGSLCVGALEVAQGDHQLKLTVDAVTQGRVGRDDDLAGALLHKHAWYVFLISRREGRVLEAPLKEMIRGLPSFFSLHVRADRGTQLRKTVDLLTTPGYCILMHENPQTIESDYQRIREEEDSGFILAAS